MGCTYAPQELVDANEYGRCWVVHAFATRSSTFRIHVDNDSQKTDA